MAAGEVGGRRRRLLLRVVGALLTALFFWMMWRQVGAVPPGPRWDAVPLGDGRFTMRFPGRPEQGAQQVDQGEEREPLLATQFLYSEGEVVYAAGYVDYPGGFSRQGTQRLFDESQHTFLKDREGRVVHQEEVGYQQYPGREIQVAFANGLVAWYRLYLVRNRLYILSVVTTREQRSAVSPHSFLDSFELVRFY